jgi:methionyl aminopeptidase
MVKPGATTGELDKVAEAMILQAKAKAAFKGYQMRNNKPYPAVICSSVNEEIVHGIPGPRVLKEGDIVGVDVGVIYKGFVGDAARTYPVGEVSPAALKLLNVTRESLYEGIQEAVAGNRLQDISGAIQRHVESHGFSVVRDFVGHGIAERCTNLPRMQTIKGGWNSPPGWNGTCPGTDSKRKTWKIKLLDDEWTAVTADGKVSAHLSIQS